jgi:ribose transport system ATP-binding protein
MEATRDLTAETIGAPPVLTIRGLSKTFPGTKALDRVDFDVRPGEIHALIGQNGSGKSTLIKVLAGYHQPDPGSDIRLAGEGVDLRDTTASRDAGFRFVHQDLGLVETLSAVENLTLGRELDTAFGGRIRWGAECRDAERRMRALGYDFDVRRPVAELGAAERTGIAIARALWDWEQARVLIVDEPTASLPREEVRVLFDALDRVRKQGLGVIYVSHRLDEIFKIGDRVTVLRDGKRVGTWDVERLDPDRLVSLMVGSVELRPPHDRVFRGTQEVALEIQQLRGLEVDNVDIEARRGEVVGIAGLTGSGREELLPLLFGTASRGGEVRLDGRIVPADPRGAMAAGMALVPADRRAEGAVVGLSVRENCTLTDLERHSARAGRLNRSAERAEVLAWIEELDVRPRRPDAVFGTLSGGNQQKVVLAKWLRRKPRVLLLDEPTQGVDVHAKATIHALAREVAADGAVVVIASSDDAELCDTCDRVLVMRSGEVVAEVEGDRLTPEELGRLQLEVART